METISQVKLKLGLTDSDIISIRKAHSTHLARGYVLKTNDKVYFVKEYIREGYIKERSVPSKYTVEPEQGLTMEVESINRLNAVKVQGVVTPEIIAYDLDNLFLIQEYVESVGFYKCLAMNFNRVYLNKNLNRQFFNIGEYLARLHNNYFQGYNNNGHPISFLHGDLNNKNVRFMNEGVFIFDPANREIRRKDSIYRDIGRFFLIFYPFNYLLNLVIPDKKLSILKSSFLTGYMHHSNFKIDLGIVKEFMLCILKEHGEYIRGNPPLKEPTLKNIFISSRAIKLASRIEGLSLHDITGDV